MGDLQRDRVVEVDFDEDNSRKSVITLYYDTVKGLRDKGVPVPSMNEPNPFPAEPTRARYTCPDA